MELAHFKDAHPPLFIEVNQLITEGAKHFLYNS